MDKMFEKSMSMLTSSYLFRKALTEDYCEVISKLTNVPIDEIKERIKSKAEKERIKLKSELENLQLLKEEL